METTTMLLLARWKAAKGIKTDADAAHRLKVSGGAVSNWKHGTSHAEPVSAERMALDLKMDAGAVLAAIEADRAHLPQVAAVWRRYGKGAFMALLVGLAFQVQAAPTAPGHDIAPHYAKWRKRAPRSQRARPARKPRRRQPHKKRFSCG